MKLALTEAALEDLRSIRRYTLETWGAEQEELYLDKLWLRIEAIRSDPFRYRLCEDLFPGCRIAYQGRHILLFRATEGSLEIACVLHSAMDLKSHLPPENF
jgi:toxin ParE1/3/4